MKIESRFEDSARRLIRDLLQSNPTDFWDVVRQSLGLFPTEVYRIMEEIDPQKLKTLVSKSRREMPDYKRRINVENNPILSSWYFTDATCRKIRNLRNWKNSRVAFLGAPKLFDWFASRRIGKSRLLIDLDEKVIDALRKKAGSNDQFLLHDIRLPVPAQFHKKFDMVFMDPPWYVKDYFLWLEQARIVGLTGDLIVSLFPQLTRPSAKSDRRKILEMVRINARDTWVIDSFLQYEVATFELGQLKGAGIRNIQPWKIADLLIIQGLTQVRDKQSRPSNSMSDVQEFDFGHMRVFLIHDKDRGDEKQLLRPVSDRPDYLLDSPSHRNPQLKRANVLTSRGHGFVTFNHKELSRILSELSSIWGRGDFSDAIRRSDMDRQTKVIISKILTE